MSFKEEQEIREIYMFVESKLTPLKDEIEREEQLKENVAVILDYDETRLHFIFQQHSDELIKKMKARFSKEDMIYLKGRIDENLHSFFGNREN